MGCPRYLEPSRSWRSILGAVVVLGLPGFLGVQEEQRARTGEGVLNEGPTMTLRFLG
jgi:hypothetical protein